MLPPPARLSGDYDDLQVTDYQDIFHFRAVFTHTLAVLEDPRYLEIISKSLDKF